MTTAVKVTKVAVTGNRLTLSKPAFRAWEGGDEPFSDTMEDFTVVIKIIISLMILFMLFNLFRAMIIMLKNDPNQPSMSKFIGRRVMTSVAIVLLILLAVATGLIEPNPRPY